MMGVHEASCTLVARVLLDAGLFFVWIGFVVLVVGGISVDLIKS